MSRYGTEYLRMLEVIDERFSIWHAWGNCLSPSHRSLVRRWSPASQIHTSIQNPNKPRICKGLFMSTKQFLESLNRFATAASMSSGSCRLSTAFDCSSCFQSARYFLKFSKAGVVFSYGSRWADDYCHRELHWSQTSSCFSCLQRRCREQVVGVRWEVMQAQAQV